MGYNNIKTPNIDKLAEDGIFFKHAISPGSYTFLSFPSILTSRYPSEYFAFQKKARTFVDFLKEYGYKTVSFNSNPHARGSLDKDFDFFDDLLRYSEFDRPFEKLKRRVEKKIGRSYIIKKFRKLLIHFSSDIAKPYADAEKMNEKASSWIRNNSSIPILFWIHYMDPHYPYYPPREFTQLSKKEIARLNRLCWINLRLTNKSNNKNHLSKEDINNIIKLYDGEIAYVDYYIGQFINNLKDMNIYDDSLIFLLSDHGDMFGEHGKFSHGEYNLYNGQLQVPLIIKGLDEKKKKFNHYVTTMDLASTLIDSLGLESSTFNTYDLIKNRREYIISEGFKPLNALSGKNIDFNKINLCCFCNNWKLIENSIEDKKELYNLKKDKDENYNLIENESEIASYLSNIIRKHKQEIFKTKELRKNIQQRVKRIKI